MGSSSVIRWMVFQMMTHAPLTWANEINCYFHGQVIGCRRQIPWLEMLTNVIGSGALVHYEVGNRFKSRVVCKKASRKSWQTSPTCRSAFNIVSMDSESHVMCQQYKQNFSVGIWQDRGLLVGHNAVWSPNFYMLCNDLSSVVSRSFGIFYGYLYAKCRSSLFHAFFSGRKWWPRNRKWRPFWVDWVALVIKSLHRKKFGSSNAFSVPDGTLRSLLHLCHVLDYVFSIFHFYEVVNCKP